MGSCSSKSLKNEKKTVYETPGYLQVREKSREDYIRSCIKEDSNMLLVLGEVLKNFDNIDVLIPGGNLTKENIENLRKISLEEANKLKEIYILVESNTNLMLTILENSSKAFDIFEDLQKGK